MKLGEAIKHLEESLADQSHDWGCEECKGEHEQLLEWLRELKEARRLLKWAVEGFRKLGASLNDDGECDGDCLYCPINNHGNCLKWEYEAEALALIGGTDK